MTAEWFVGRELGTALALLVSSWSIGIGAALIVLPRVATASSMATAFVMTAVAAAVGLLLIALIYRVPPTFGDTAPTARSLASGLSLE
jgi:sugar phosphate permease